MCPANYSQCFKCGKLDHFKKPCRARPVKSIEAALNILYLVLRVITLGRILTSRAYHEIKVIFWEMCQIINLMHIHSYSKPMVNVLVNGVNLKFTIDTGADVTAVPKDMFEFFDGINIMPSSQILTGPQCDQLNVEGKFIAKLETEIAAPIKIYKL